MTDYWTAGNILTSFNASSFSHVTAATVIHLKS